MLRIGQRNLCSLGKTSGKHVVVKPLKQHARIAWLLREKCMMAVYFHMCDRPVRVYPLVRQHVCMQTLQRNQTLVKLFPYNTRKSRIFIKWFPHENPHALADKYISNFSVFAKQIFHFLYIHMYKFAIIIHILGHMYDSLLVMR